MTRPKRTYGKDPYEYYVKRNIEGNIKLWTELSKEHPNDMELGKMIRFFINKANNEG